MNKQPYTLSTIDFYREGNQCKITFLNSQMRKAQLLIGDTPEKVTEVISTTSSNTFEFNLTRDKLYYYQITGAIESPVFAERLLPLQGAINVRDMGGYQTVSKKSVKWGLLYRGDQLSQLTEKDIQFLKKIAFHSIIDFRNAQERELSPNYAFDTVKNYYNCDPHSTVSEAAGAVVSFEEENKLIVKNLEDGAVPREELNGSGNVFHKNYREFVTSDNAKEAFSKMIRALLKKENTPIFMHCRGGKDRTGFGSALILSILGVNQREIFIDYLITQEVRIERTRFKMAQYRKYTENKNILEYLKAMIDTRQDYLEASFKVIEESFGSIDGYVSHLGITTEEVELLKKIYLE